MSAHDCPHCDCESNEDIERFWKHYADLKKRYQAQEKLDIMELMLLQAGDAKVAELTRPNPLFGKGEGKTVKWTF